MGNRSKRATQNMISATTTAQVKAALVIRFQ